MITPEEREQLFAALRKALDSVKMDPPKRRTGETWEAFKERMKREEQRR